MKIMEDMHMSEYKLKPGKIGESVIGATEENNVRTITVLFTRYYSIFSNFIYWAGGKGYTHASISLDDSNEYFYSFNFRGFRKEYPGRHKKRSGESVGYRLEISGTDFDKMKFKIAEMERAKEQFRYSRAGVFLCLLHIPWDFKNRYFCSRFVAELLSLSDRVSLKKRASLYLPCQLDLEIRVQNCLKEVLCNPV